MENRNEKDLYEADAVTAADGASGAVGFLESLRRIGAGARDLIREVCTFEVLGLCTMLLPALMAGVGFFFGQTVTPFYFYVSVVILLVCSFVGGWKRGVAYVALLAVCTVLTMFTFSYLGYDTQVYHFPMQHLLRNGWNPVFDSTVEKLYPLVEGTHLRFYHTLFLPKFQELCGAIVSSAFRLFVGEAFLAYLLLACLFTTCLDFARRYWGASAFWRVLFAAGMTFTIKTHELIDGSDTYLAYSSLLMAILALALYRSERRVQDLVLFVVSACICMTTKTTGILCVGLLVLLTFPLLWTRTAYWHALLALGLLVAVVGASPLLTNWIQYGSPFYPSMTFCPNVPVIDFTSDLTGNADAMSMGYLSRICYAWVSPKLTVAALRFLTGDSDFNPVFAPPWNAAGQGWWFNCLLLVSVVLLAVSRKNMVTWLCVVILASANFAPIKCLGYSRYFPQIWAIFPLAVMNFVCATGRETVHSRMRLFRQGTVVSLAVAIAGLSGASFSRMLFRWGKQLFEEGQRQVLISTLPKEVSVDDPFCRYTTIQRFRQAGVKMAKVTDETAVDTVAGARDVDWIYYLILEMPHRDSVTLRLALPSNGEGLPRQGTKQSALTCVDPRTGERFSFYSNMEFDSADADQAKALFSKGWVRAIIDNFPRVLWDNGQGGACRSASRSSSTR